MALGLNFGTVADNDGETLFSAFTKINTILSTTTKLSNGDLEFNGVKFGEGNGSLSTNLAIGKDAGINLSPIQDVQGDLNVLVGLESGKNTTSGRANTFVGVACGRANTSGNYNSYVGANTGKSATGSYNAFFGQAAGENNTDGYFNTFIGYTTGQNSTTGSYGTFVGSLAGFNNGGQYNTFLGQAAGYSNQGGSANTFLGQNSGFYTTSGGSNTFVGANAGQANIADNNITCLGSQSAATGSNQIQLGAGSTTCYTNGAVQNRSDLRDKADVRDTVLGLDFISKLRAVDYKWDMREDYKDEAPLPLDINATDEEKLAHKIASENWLESVKLDNLTHNGSNKRSRYHHGLIAQEVQDVINETGIDFGGFQDHKVQGGQDVLSIGYSELIAPMIKAIQELSLEVKSLKSEIELLKAI
jgi:hypothetical protein